MVKYATVAALPTRGTSGSTSTGSGVKLSRSRKDSFGGSRRLTSIVHNSAVQLILQNLTGKVRYAYFALPLRSCATSPTPPQYIMCYGFVCFSSSSNQSSRLRRFTLEPRQTGSCASLHSNMCAFAPYVMSAHVSSYLCFPIASDVSMSLES